MFSCRSSINQPIPQTTSYAIRLKPGGDLRRSLDSFVKVKNIASGWVASCAGSLTKYNIRFANQPNGSSDTGHFEIVSLTGTLSKNGSHVHIAVSDSSGKTIGGHLLEDCMVYTTAEIIIQQANDLIFNQGKRWEHRKGRVAGKEG